MATTKATEAARLAISAAAAGHAFELDYCHQILPDSVRINYQFRAARVVMLRLAPDRMLGETADSFAVHSADDGRWLGEGDTKQEAAGEAKYRLMKESEAAFSAAQQTTAAAA